MFNLYDKIMKTIDKQKVIDEILRNFIENWNPNENSGSFISAPIWIDQEKYVYSIMIFTPDFGVTDYKAYNIFVESESFTDYEQFELPELLGRITWIMNNYRKPEKLVYHFDIIVPESCKFNNNQLN